MHKKILSLVAVILIGLILVGCGGKGYTEDDVKSFAHPLTEKVLLGLNNEDYSMFASDFNEDMQTGIPEEQFSSLLSQIKGKVGDYVPDSKKFVSATQKGSYITVVYDAKFTQEDSVKITISFEQIEGTYKISGLYFNSPKLQGK
ncbi:MAG: hypothetical protein AUJ99_05955 [Caldisericum sp. CG2_30_36_11]|nr:DUF3887 domain-containing protein [Caldisericota bacterium]NCQ53308.1 DUF3887 domain-containing protein [Caldisericota bacterium]OIP12038.1 MAG: hypothetical protein AUJ99_05955 [Caldisericum sp. CG2_30_36_11]PIP49948.1 MAG: hypothetical protein COX13_01120 [Caldiserica bacterium CG23_combo_of_CG06-09_8_20_14_all_35_60]PIX29805.1 MAG: hypothetical protein COZ65_00410 [Caldiserica bacterium CG_4_8_14_3_um_filter_35_18]